MKPGPRIPNRYGPRAVACLFLVSQVLGACAPPAPVIVMESALSAWVNSPAEHWAIPREPFVLTGTATGPAGHRVELLEFYANSVKVGEVRTDPTHPFATGSVRWTPSEEGPYQIQVKATNDQRSILSPAHSLCVGRHFWVPGPAPSLDCEPGPTWVGLEVTAGPSPVFRGDCIRGASFDARIIGGDPTHVDHMFLDWWVENFDGTPASDVLLGGARVEMSWGGSIFVYLYHLNLWDATRFPERPLRLAYEVMAVDRAGAVVGRAGGAPLDFFACGHGLPVVELEASPDPVYRGACAPSEAVFRATVGGDPDPVDEILLDWGVRNPDGSVVEGATIGGEIDRPMVADGAGVHTYRADLSSWTHLPSDYLRIDGTARAYDSEGALLDESAAETIQFFECGHGRPRLTATAVPSEVFRGACDPHRLTFLAEASGDIDRVAGALLSWWIVNPDGSTPALEGATGEDGMGMIPDGPGQFSYVRDFGTAESIGTAPYLIEYTVEVRDAGGAILREVRGEAIDFSACGHGRLTVEASASPEVVHRGVCEPHRVDFEARLTGGVARADQVRLDWHFANPDGSLETGAEFTASVPSPMSAAGDGLYRLSQDFSDLGFLPVSPYSLFYRVRAFDAADEILAEGTGGPLAFEIMCLGFDLPGCLGLALAGLLRCELHHAADGGRPGSVVPGHLWPGLGAGSLCCGRFRRGKRRVGPGADPGRGGEIHGSALHVRSGPGDPPRP